MGTYGDMQSRIASEIKRSGLTSDIQAAIQSAVKAHECRPYWFNQQRATMPTVAGVKVYSLPTTAPEGPFKQMRFLRITIGNAIYPLEEYTKSEALEVDDSTSFQGQPDHYYIDWAEVTAPSYMTVGQLWLLPVPNAVYSVEMQYYRDLGALSALGDQNAWTNEAELMIRCRAKRELYTHVIRDTEEALKFAAAEQAAVGELRKSNSMRRAPGRIRASW